MKKGRSEGERKEAGDCCVSSPAQLQAHRPGFTPGPGHLQKCTGQVAASAHILFSHLNTCVASEAQWGGMMGGSGLKTRQQNRTAGGHVELRVVPDSR